jgi:hypothetical protein
MNYENLKRRVNRDAEILGVSSATRRKVHPYYSPPHPRIMPPSGGRGSGVEWADDCGRELSEKAVGRVI